MINEKIDEKLLQQAIKAIRDLNRKFYEDESKKKPLLEDNEKSTLYLQFSLKKIPKCKSMKMIKIKLPHSLAKDDAEVCLIAGDLDKKNHKAEIEPDVLHYKELLKKHDINNISQVVTLRQLRTEYKPYEAKQKLLAAYDVFLADRKIVECLPKVLGRHFFKKRKFPIQITLNTPNLKQQVEKALSTKVFYLTGLGNSCNSEVAYLDMADTEISENIISMTNAFCNELPGSWDNIMGIYLKTSLSKAVPVYISYDDPNKILLEEEKSDTDFIIDELSTEPDKLVKVYRNGTVRTMKRKIIPEDETSETTTIEENFEKKKKKKDVTVDDSADIDTHLNGGETASSRKKSRKMKKEIVADGADNFVVTHLNKESTNVKKKSKHTKTEKETENSVWSIDSKGETADVSGDLKTKKKKKRTTVCDSIPNVVNTQLNEKPTTVIKKPKSGKKEKSILAQDSENNVHSAVSKDKKKKRKLIETITVV